MHIYNNPSGEAYYRLIDYATKVCETFSLMDNRFPEGDEYEIMPYFPLRIVEELKPYLVREKWAVRRIHAAARSYEFDLPIYVWRCCPETAEILKRYSDNLQSWIGQGMPEDLCFQQADGEDWLRTVTHESYRELRVTPEEAEMLKESLRGVMLVDIKEPPAPEELFELAKYHESDRLELQGTGTAELAERLVEIPSLRNVELFDAHLRELPDTLFGLPNLEELTVYAGNLSEIPSAIGRAGKLRSFQLVNACHPEPHSEPEWQAPSKEELLLKTLPPEIGMLENLESLHIEYSGLMELPDELGNLRRLKYLSLTNHRIEGKPAVLKKLRHARNITFKRDGFF
ncbi:hypothetical protein CDO73_10540 [Saccharibacillus sp. O23]|uniref:leucine-rich repeat domain-containing protein n=1 Tax=Saccharibacillus sp. O23 TaxID=2009338 RepID=UPI000B4E8120|nr:leucine-rich repeat domain-containing protein [Saccharibacillus sp. O23]OWR30355.1 hypothetical protein CDO73_10540 [Saccharibacillus sp. O23]